MYERQISGIIRNAFFFLFNIGVQARLFVKLEVALQKLFDVESPSTKKYV